MFSEQKDIPPRNTEGVKMLFVINAIKKDTLPTGALQKPKVIAIPDRLPKNQVLKDTVVIIITEHTTWKLRRTTTKTT